MVSEGWSLYIFFTFTRDPKDNDTPIGWKNCKELAQIFIDSDFDLSKDPQQNAGTYTLI